MERIADTDRSSLFRLQTLSLSLFLFLIKSRARVYTRRVDLRLLNRFIDPCADTLHPFLSLSLSLTAAFSGGYIASSVLLIFRRARFLVTRPVTSDESHFIPLFVRLRVYIFIMDSQT